MELNELRAFEKLRNHLLDKNWRLNHLYYIKDKNGKKIKFKHNSVQSAFREKKHNRNIVLKARQQGFTTEACIDALDSCLFNSYYDAGIIAHTVQDAEKIFTNKIKFAFDELPQWLKEQRRPNTDRAGEMRFPNGSSISVSTGYRGGTLMRLHVSELSIIVAKYPDKAKEIISGAFNAVPMNGEITVESTARGTTGEFYEMCERAQLYTSYTPLDFKFHFFAWHESKEYRLNPAGIEINEKFQNYFKMLKSEHNIDLDSEQKAWYVKKSEEQGEEMHQEYPSYPGEAFLASGRPVFNLEKLSRDIKRTRLKKPLKGYLSELGSFTEDSEGTLLIYKLPSRDHAYAIGADPAEGLETGDNSAISVIDKDFNQCATYCGKMEPDTFGKFLVKLAKFYNGAILAPEVNNHGHAVLQSIKNEKYYKVYKREVKEELGQDIQEKVGWLNTVKSKMQMLDDLKAAFRDDSLQINCEATLREMMSVVIEEDGNIIVNGKDRTVALGISIQALKQASIEGEHKAIVPSESRAKDPTRMSVEDKLAFYKKRRQA